MKKLIFSLAALAIGTLAYAQKPAAGDKTAETLLNLNFGNPGITYGTPEFRLRYFMSENRAARLRVALGSTSSTDKPNDSTEVKSSSGFTISIAPGYEMHLPGTSKLSPYVGVQLPISFGTGSTVETTNQFPKSGLTTSTTKETGGSTLSIGLSLALGADYYIAESVYVGAEMGLGIFNMTSEGESTTSVTGQPDDKGGATSSFDLFGVSPTSGIRLGMRF